MEDDGKNKFDLNMKQFEQFFKKNFPGLQSIDWKEWSSTNSIGNYVDKIINNSFNQNGIGKHAKTFFISEVFETHNRVIAKVEIPKHVKPYELRLYVKGNQIKLEYKKETQLIRLPAYVNSRTVKALLRDGILQVQMKKQNKAENYREVYIRSS